MFQTAFTDIQAAPDGSLWVGGETSSPSFSVTAGAFQTQLSGDNAIGYLLHLSADGSTALTATYLPESLTSLALDGSGNVIVGAPFQSGFVATPGSTWPCQQTNSGVPAGFIGKIDAQGQHLFGEPGLVPQSLWVRSLSTEVEMRWPRDSAAGTAWS